MYSYQLNTKFVPYYSLGCTKATKILPQDGKLRAALKAFTIEDCLWEVFYMTVVTVFIATSVVIIHILMYILCDFINTEDAASCYSMVMVSNLLKVVLLYINKLLLKEWFVIKDHLQDIVWLGQVK